MLSGYHANEWVLTSFAEFWKGEKEIEQEHCSVYLRKRSKFSMKTEVSTKNSLRTSELNALCSFSGWPHDAGFTCAPSLRARHFWEHGCEMLPSNVQLVLFVPVLQWKGKDHILCAVGGSHSHHFMFVWTVRTSVWQRAGRLLVNTLQQQLWDRSDN